MQVPNINRVLWRVSSQSQTFQVTAWLSVVVWCFNISPLLINFR